MCQEEKYKMFFNVEGNGTMYKEFKLKNTNWIVMFSFYKSPSSLSKGITCSIFHQFQHFCIIGCTKNITIKFVWMSEAMEQHKKNLNSKT
jgi:hypothetical protein